MSDSRFAFLKHPTARAIILALIVVLVAYSMKMWKDWADAAPGREQEAVAAKLLQTMAALEAASGDDTQATLAALPQRTDWHPVLDCAQMTATFGPPPPSWKGLPKMAWQGQEVGYSFRFHVVDTQMVFLARRDADCDGLYEIHQVTMAPSLVGGWSTSEPSSQNKGE